jgi:hypothetical protein
MNITSEENIYLCITEPYQQLIVLSFVELNKKLVREGPFIPKNNDKKSTCCVAG